MTIILLKKTRKAIKEIFSDLEISAIEKVRLALIKLVKDQNPEDIQNKYGISKDEAITWPTFVLNQKSPEK